MITTCNTLSALQQKLLHLPDNVFKKKVFVGFDGFIDYIRKPVKQRQNFKTEYFRTLPEFASRIRSAAGKSGQIEMVTEKVKLGGNAPIFSNTLGKLGLSSYCLGSMGYPELHPVFSAMSPKCEVLSVLNPGESYALEFDDGKIIFSELSVFDQFTWAYIRNTFSLEKLKDIIRASRLLAFVDWVNLPHSSDIWEGILEDIIKPLGRNDFYFLFDLCDPSKKTTEQIDEVLDLISCFSPYGKVTLGLNENETMKIWRALNGVEDDGAASEKRLPTVSEAGDFIYKTMNIDCLLVHPIDRAVTFHQYDVLEIQGRLVTQPKVLTGGGDNLNAGYCLGLLAGFSLPECMLLGMATSGAYIQNGFTPSLDEIIAYMDIWKEDLLQVKAESPRSFAFRHL